MERTPVIPTTTPWKPSADELNRILDEMRPIIRDFTERAASFLAESEVEAKLLAYC